MHVSLTAFAHWVPLPCIWLALSHLLNISLMVTSSGRSSSISLLKDIILYLRILFVLYSTDHCFELIYLLV